MKKLIVGNWKMNGTLQGAKQLIADLINGLYEHQALMDRFEFVVCPPFLHIYAIRHALRTTSYLQFGGQDCSSRDDGAFTGDVSARMLRDSGCKYVILGHSERREHHAEGDAMIAAKALKAHENGLIPIICVGETADERAAGRQEEVVARQLDLSLPQTAAAGNLVIAYEPVWAIGTGKNASPADIAAMHGFIRGVLAKSVKNGGKVPILYGGSMKPENAGPILALADVDGGLIGGASLNAAQFLGIALQAQKE